jgi:recombinational DNA repair protein RecT
LNGLSLTKQHYDLIVRGGSPNFQIRAKGWYKIALDDPKVKRIEVYPVWNNEEFSIKRENGKTTIEHIPSFESEKSIDNLKLAYGIIYWADGDYSVELLTKGDVLKRKSLAQGETFWDKWFEEMINKTILKYCAMKHSVGINYNFAGEGEDISHYEDESEEGEIYPHVEE